MSDDPPVRDAWEEAAALITEVARLAEDARRYRALVPTVAEPTFDRALAIGSEIRAAVRAGRSEALDAAVRELLELRRHCEGALAELRASAPYRDLVAAYVTGDAARATDLASRIYSDVTPAPATDALHWPLPIRGRGGTRHFVSAEECAAKIGALAASGIPAPAEAPAVGGDATVRPIRLSFTPDAAESPISLVIGPEAVPGPIARVAASDVALWYAERLSAPFVVRAAATVGDEWWQVRPDAYRSYVESLRGALALLGWKLETAASDAE